MEKLARDKEKRYADAQRQTEEKKALNEQIAKFTAEYEKVSLILRGKNDIVAKLVSIRLLCLPSFKRKLVL